MSLSFRDWPNYSLLANYSPWPHLSLYWSWASAFLSICVGKGSSACKIQPHLEEYLLSCHECICVAILCTCLCSICLDLKHQIVRTGMSLLSNCVIYSCRWMLLGFLSDNSSWQWADPQFSPSPCRAVHSTWRAHSSLTHPFLRQGFGGVSLWLPQHPQIHFSVKTTCPAPPSQQKTADAGKQKQERSLACEVRQAVDEAALSAPFVVAKHT